LEKALRKEEKDFRKEDFEVEEKLEPGDQEKEKVFPPSFHSPVKTTQGVSSGQDGQCSIAREAEERFRGLAPFQRLRECLGWWSQHAPPRILKLICQGVEPQFQGDHLHLHEQRKSPEEIALASKVMADYVEAKATREVPPSETTYLVPWFVIRKAEPQGGEKLRLISDCREINKGLEAPHFKLDHWKEIFPHLQKGMWATKVDLKNAYFHLELSSAIKPFIRMKIGERNFQMEGACFGLSSLPYWWMQLMNVLLKKWRKQGMQVFIYLDDILLIAKSKNLAEKQTGILLQDLVSSGLTINFKKSKTSPSQLVDHLGFQMNLAQGNLQVPQAKLKSIRKELGKFITQTTMNCRKAAAILGQVRSFLTALPCLRAFTDHLVRFVDQSVHQGWDKKLPIPPIVKDQVQEIGVLLRSWEGRSFNSQCSVRKIHSDSSDLGWGAIDLSSGAQLQEFWRSEKGLHINIKELKAAIAAVQSLARPGENVFLSIDNQVAYSYLRKEGGRLPKFNSLMRPFLNWCHSQKIKITPNWVRSEEMLADGLSRWGFDRGVYTLNLTIFQEMLKIFSDAKFSPTVDMFASPGNKKFPQFVSRWPHHQAVAVNALECPLQQFRDVYANPPWSLILQWLMRLKSNPHLICLTVIPQWVGTVWWPLLTRLRIRNTPVVLIEPREGLFQNCLGEDMPPTRWPLLCLLLSGKAYRENKFHLKISHYI
jgi:hypothetical protein